MTEETIVHVVDDDEAVRGALSRLLRSVGYGIRSHATASEFLKEALALIRQLWSEERVSFQGQYYRTDKATIYDKPAIAPPIYVAAAGPVFAKYAGQFADGFICTSGKAPELYRDTLLPNVAAGMAACSAEVNITAETARLTRLINNVLDFARLERRQKRFEKRPLDLHDIRAHVGQDLAGERTGQSLGDLDDLDAFERQRCSHGEVLVSVPS